MEPRRDQTAQAALRNALFRPRSVGLVGLSSDPGRPTGRPLEYLRRAGFDGAVYVVNPMRDTVQGARAIQRRERMLGMAGTFLDGAADWAARPGP